MGEQFQNNYTTTLNGAINNSTGSITVTSGPSMNGNFRIKIDNEIILVGSASGTSFTNCIRGVEGTSAASHSDGATVSHVLTANALKSVGGFLWSTKAVAETPDDEFGSTSLDGKWTVVNGASGTVDFLPGTSSSAVYDLSSRRGWLLMQTGVTSGNKVTMRQDYTIPIGSSLIVAIALGSPSIDGATGWAADEQQVGITLNSDDSADTAGSEKIDFYAMEVDANVTDIQSIHTGATAGANGTSTIWRPMGTMIYLRIARTATGIYWPLFSMDGYSWAGMDDYTFTTGAFNNIWLWVKCAATVGSPAPVHAFAWVRQGTNGIDPWPWASK